MTSKHTRYERQSDADTIFICTSTYSRNNRCQEEFWFQKTPKSYRCNGTTVYYTVYQKKWAMDFRRDIIGCFDNIRHDWMLNNVVMDKTVLRKTAIRKVYRKTAAF